MKIVQIRKAGFTNLDGTYSGVHRLVIFGFIVWTWRVMRKSKPSDWQSTK